MESKLPEQSNTLIAQRKPLFLIVVILILAILLIAVVFYYLQIKKTSPLTDNQSSTTTAKTKLVFASDLISPVQVKGTQTAVFSCPALPSFCSNNLNFKGQFMSGNLPANTLLFAAFDGDLTSLISYRTDENTKEQFTTLILTNKEKGLIAYYRFKGTGADSKTVKAGDSIGTANGQLLLFYNASLAFEVNRIATENSGILTLKKEDFK